MVDRIASDHPDIRTVRIRVRRHGGRLRLDLPSDANIGVGDEGEIETIVDGSRLIARIRRVDGDRNGIVGLFETTAAASGSTPGENRLATWLDDIDRDVGDSVLLDVVATGIRIGLREPGSSTAYSIPGHRDRSLEAIAKRVTSEE